MKKQLEAEYYMNKDLDGDNKKSGLDERYFIKQSSDASSSCELTSEDIVNFDDNDTIIEENEDEEIDDDDKWFTSILVEDGFIRMTSPANSEDEISSSDYNNYCEFCKSKTSDTFDALRCSTYSCYLRNFPNVGSSPVFNNEINCSDDEDSASCSQNNLIYLNQFYTNNNSDIFDEDSDDEGIREEENIQEYDEDDTEKELEGVKEIEEEDEEEEEGEEEEEEEEEEIIDNEDENDEDEVIVHNQSLSNLSNEITEVINTEKKPQPIIKKSSLALLEPPSTPDILDDPLVTQQNTLNNEKIAQIIAINNLESSNHILNNNNGPSTKPKVRFNLDVNYEKEREWNRINKILGDVSKSQIEWTDEVEV